MTPTHAIGSIHKVVRGGLEATVVVGELAQQVLQEVLARLTGVLLVLAENGLLEVLS